MAIEWSMHTNMYAKDECAEGVTVCPVLQWLLLQGPLALARLPVVVAMSEEKTEENQGRWKREEEVE